MYVQLFEKAIDINYEGTCIFNLRILLLYFYILSYNFG